MKIIDNFLPDENFSKVKNVIMGSSFPWYYLPSVAFEGDENDKHYFMSHVFYKDNAIKSDFYGFLLDNFLYKININKLIRIKANFFPRTEVLSYNKRHTDYVESHKGCVFSINTCDGATVLDNDKKVESIENRILFHNPSKKHNSTTCTNAKGRFNIVVNYL